MTRIGNDSDIYRPEVLKTIEEEINKYKKDLTGLSLKIHGMWVKSSNP